MMKRVTAKKARMTQRAKQAYESYEYECTLYLFKHMLLFGLKTLMRYLITLL